MFSSAATSIRVISRARCCISYLQEPRQLTACKLWPGVEANDLKRILAAQSDPPATTSTCIASNPNVLQVLALYRGAPADTPLPTEWLVDVAGSLRAIWYPGNGASWNDPITLKHRLDDIRRISAVARAAGGHAHHH